MTGYFATDDIGTHTIQVGASTVSVYGSFHSLTNISGYPGLGGLFQAGQNTLSFVIHNTASVTGLYANVSISATCAQPPTVAIAKTSSTTAALASGDTVNYTVTVSNTSATTPATNVLVADLVPTGIDPASVSWDCAGAACPAPTSGTGALSQTVATLPAGANVIYTITATATGASSPVTNTATATGPGLVCADGAPLPCTAQVSNPLAEADMRGSATSVPATVGAPVTVTLSCTNAGPNPAVNATCEVSGAPAGATTTCTPAAPVASLAVGSSITCTTTFTPLTRAQITLTATAGSDTPDPTRANNTGRATIAPAGAVAASVPTLGELTLALLALLLGGGAALRMRSYQ